MDSSNLDLNAVRVFLAVVEHGGFRQAAVRLGQSKSTVSRLVAELEATLGQQLLRRTTRTVALTEVGDGFFRQASQSLSGLSDAVRVLKESEAAPRGLLKVTAPPTFAELFLGGVLTGFARKYPEVRLLLDLNDRYVDLVAEGFDVALRAGVLPDSSLKARLLGASPVLCFASRDYLAQRGRPATPAELREHDVIAFGTDERKVKWPFMVKRARQVFELKPRITVNSFVLIHQLAVQGLGIARIPGGLATEAARGGKLVEVLADFATPPSPMHAVFAPSAYPSPRVRVFLDYVSEHLVTPAWSPRARG